MYRILILFSILLIGAAIFYFFKKRNFGKIEASSLTTLPHAMTSGSNPIFLKCWNLKHVYSLIGTIFWGFSIFFMIMAAAESNNQHIALPAGELVDSITRQRGWIYAPIVFMIIILYILYNRIKISWDNGLLISGKPADILYFELKKTFGTITLLYLQSKDRRWILVPATSEEMKKFGDENVLNKQIVFNEIQIQQLKRNLIKFGVQEKIYNQFTKYVVFGFAAFILSLAWVMTML